MAEFSLPCGARVLLDDADYHLVGESSWFALRTAASRTVYVVREFYITPGRRGRRRVEQMHRVIMQPRKNETVDHINGNGLDNRRENLRICSTRQNAWNARLSKANTSGVKGVCWAAREGKWLARVYDNRKVVWGGYFSCLAEAKAAIMAARERLHGEFARHG